MCWGAGGAVEWQRERERGREDFQQCQRESAAVTVPRASQSQPEPERQTAWQTEVQVGWVAGGTLEKVGTGVATHTHAHREKVQHS